VYNVVFLSPTADTLVRTEITYDLGDNRNASRELTQHVCDMSVSSQHSPPGVWADWAANIWADRKFTCSTWPSREHHMTITWTSCEHHNTYCFSYSTTNLC